MALAINQLLQGRYRILRQLGQGGMGAVYLAEDARLGRQCAVKENVPDLNANPQVLAQMRQQFQVEARILASLDHPNLTKVYDFFQDGGNEYIVMDYVEGDNLATLLQRQGGPLPERPVLLWADQVLDALEYLHGQRPNPLIHRDIKPGNIILTAQGKIKLVDFGLVKLFDPNNPSTVTSMKGMGTPEYAPLEQYGKGVGHTDARSDIYSLGATLYHLLTDTVPPEVTQRVLDARKLVPPRQLNPALTAGTEAVILRAMDISPAQRFSTAHEMRQALAGAQPPQPARAAAVPTARAPMPARISPTLLLPPPKRGVPLWAMILVVLAVLSAGIGLASQMIHMGPTPSAVTPTISPGATRPIPAFITTGNVARLSDLIQLPERAQDVAFAPDGQTLALAEADGIALWNLRTVSRTGFITTSAPSVLVYGADSRRLLTGSKDNGLQLWDVPSGSMQALLEGHTAAITGVAFAMNGRLAASSSKDNTVRVWDRISHTERYQLMGHTNWVMAVAFSPNGGLLASAGRDAVVQLWNLGNGKLEWSFRGHAGPVSSVAINPDGKLLASGSEDNTVRLWNLETHTLARTLIGHLDGVTSVAFSADGSLLASSGKDGTVRLWDADAGIELRTLKSQNSQVLSIDFDPKGLWIAAVDGNGSVNLWGVR